MAVGGVAMKREWLARGILVSFTGLLMLGVALGWRTSQEGMTLHARMAEQGGWNPATVSAKVGEPLHLRLTSDDVTHSFKVGQMDWPAVDVLPGEITELTLTFDHPGKYVFYCTRWCGPNHWRMRGTIEVSGAENSQAELATAESAPLYVDLNLDIDAPHPASATPQAKPSAATGNSLLEQVPPVYRSTVYLRTHSPAEVWQALRIDSFTQASSDQQVWDLVAGLWQMNTSQAQLNLGADLYAQNCAACHGEAGGVDGVFASQMGEQSEMPETTMSGPELKTPTDFTDPDTMLGASPALLQGKIIRGGMGTGMPYWGPIFTEDQIWAIVNYLYSFQFDFK
jgi:mono/diheme cytochrome c family protein/plastocyanin